MRIYAYCRYLHRHHHFPLSPPPPPLYSQANATIVKIDSSVAEVFHDALKLITRTFVLPLWIGSNAKIIFYCSTCSHHKAYIEYACTVSLLNVTTNDIIIINHTHSFLYSSREPWYTYNYILISVLYVANARICEAAHSCRHSSSWKKQLLLSKSWSHSWRGIYNIIFYQYPWSSHGYSFQVLAEKVVQYAGQAVALVIAGMTLYNVCTSARLIVGKWSSSVCLIG